MRLKDTTEPCVQIRFDDLTDSAAEDDIPEKLWSMIVGNENRTFRTYKGLAFSYTVKRGHNGDPTGEIFFDRKSKGITVATAVLGLKNALAEQEKAGYVKGPKKLGVFGASYLYPMFADFGLIKTGLS